jgi:hypothetical protein
MTLYIEFDVQEVQRENLNVSVSGRCVNGPIEIGDTFTTLYGRSFPDAPEDYSTSIKTEQISVSLKVLSIEAFKKSIAQLSPGIGAKLQLSGEGIGVLKGKVFLGN